MITDFKQLKTALRWLAAGCLLAASIPFAVAQKLSQKDLKTLRAGVSRNALALRTYSADATSEYIFQDGSLSALPVNALLLTVFRAEQVRQHGGVLTISGTRKLYVQALGSQKLLPTQVEQPASITIELKGKVDIPTLLKTLPEQLFFGSLQEAADALPVDRRDCILQQYDEVKRTLVTQADCIASVDSIYPKPALIKQVDPHFPEGIRGTFSVLLSMIVGEAGKPYNMQTVRSDLKALNPSALAAVAQYRFKPAMKNGKAVSFRLNVEVKFERQ